MSWIQLKTFIWLRWRLSMNHGKRLSSVNVLIDRLLKILLVIFACGSLITCFLVGRFALADTPPAAFMLAWDAAVVGFLFFTLVGLMLQLQRTEMLSLDRFLHLPVSPAGAFLINYLGSSLNPSLLLFFPGMMGLAIGLLVSRGVAMSALLVLVPCFFLMITALTYQFRGWLASMMANRRRRQTILVVLTSVFLGIVMLPSLVTGNRNAPGAAEQSERLRPDRPGPPDTIEAMERSGRFESRVRLINAVAPPGWLPHGASKTLEGDWSSVLAAMLGMGLIGALSLMRSYRTTLRLCTGDFLARPGKSESAVRRVGPRLGAKRYDARSTLTERRLPLISEHASAIAVTCLRSLLRSPEAKLTLLTPLFLLIFFSSVFANSTAEVSEYGRALRATGIAVATLLLTMLHFVGNQFAYDRDGFRSFVLCSASRRDVLLGKNLSFFPFALAFMLLAILTYHWFYPLRLDHLVAVLVQTVSIYLVYCLLGNLLSIYAPVAIRPTSGMPIPGQGSKMLLQMLMLIVFSIPLSVVLVPLGIEYAMQALDWHTWFPAFLALSLLQAALALWLYLALLGSEGMLLQRREQMILDVVTQRVD